MPVEVQITYDKQSYDAEALQKAAYRGLNYLTLEYTVDEANYYCILRPNKDISNDDFNAAVEEYRKDVVDYQLRRKIKLETEPVRNLILGIAFSQTGLQDGE